MHPGFMLICKSESSDIYRICLLYVCKPPVEEKKQCSQEEITPLESLPQAAYLLGCYCCMATLFRVKGILTWKCNWSCRSREKGRFPGSPCRKTEAKRWHCPVSGRNGLPPNSLNEGMGRLRMRAGKRISSV